MIRKFLFLLLLSCLIPMISLLSGCTSSGCRKLEQQFEGCAETWIKDYGDQQKKTCSKNTARKDCGAGFACVTPTGAATSQCYLPGSTFDKGKTIVGLVQELCNPIFTDRQTEYMNCMQAARCDINKIKACSAKLTSQIKLSKKKGPGPFFVGFIIFLIAALVVEGLFVFVGLKIADRKNPANSIAKALLFAGISGVVTFPIVYFSPLVGMFISASLMFGILVIFYHTEMLLPTIFTGFHFIFTFVTFTWLVSSSMMGGAAWLGQPSTMRLRLSERVTELHNYATEKTKEKKAIALAKKRAALEKKKEEQRKKEQAALKAKQAKDKQDAKDKKPGSR